MPDCIKARKNSVAASFEESDELRVLCDAVADRLDSKLLRPILVELSSCAGVSTAVVVSVTTVFGVVSKAP